MSIKTVVCWSDISGYMAASWRALSQQLDINLHVIAFQARTETAFVSELMAGISHDLLDLEQRNNLELIKDLVLAQSPDAIVICGWFHPTYRKLASVTEFKDIPLILAMDTPWRGALKQHFATLILKSYTKRFERVVVNGERSWQYARRLGFPSAQIMQGMCGIDFAKWSPIYDQRVQSGDWPKSFLFIGRYNEVKAVDILIEAYRAYRQQTTHPWPLVCCGQGAFDKALDAEPGIINYGFVQPSNLPDIWLQAGAFLLPSRYDPWPLALVEAAAAGLPVICTDVCGSAVEVIRSGYNGLVIPPNAREALTQALLKIHHNYDQLPTWGQRARQFAAPYAAEQWATNWRELLVELRQAGLITNDTKSEIRNQKDRARTYPDPNF